MQKFRFQRMDGCSTMSDQQNGVCAYFLNSSLFWVYVYCRNHSLPYCFAHIIPRYLNMVKFHSLLLNSFLILRNSNVKTNIVVEVQEVYSLPELKLIKNAVTCWLSHGKAAYRCLDCYTSFLVSLEKIYEKKKEPAVR